MRMSPYTYIVRRIAVLCGSLAFACLLASCSIAKKLGVSANAPTQSSPTFAGVGGLNLTTDGKHVLVWDQVAGVADPTTVTYAVYSSTLRAMPADAQALVSSNADNSGATLPTSVATMDGSDAPVNARGVLTSVTGVLSYTLAEAPAAGTITAFQVRATWPVDSSVGSGGTANSRDTNNKVLIYHPPTTNSAKTALSFSGVTGMTSTATGSLFLNWTPPVLTSAVNASGTSGPIQYNIYVASTQQSLAAVQAGALALSSGSSLALTDASGNASGTSSSSSAATLVPNVASSYQNLPLSSGQLLATQTGGSSYQITQTLDPSFVYLFQVRAVSPNGQIDTNNNVIIYQVPPVIQPTFAGCTGAKALSANSISVAYDFPSAASSVTIYRGGSSVYAAVSAGSGAFTDKGLSAGVTYNYQCVATINNKPLTGPGTQATTLGNSTPPVFAGVSSATTMTNAKILLRWTASSSSDLQQYNIYSASDLTTRIGTTTSTAFIVSGLNAGTSYTYVVRAMNTSGYEDDNTVKASATTLSYAVPDFSGLTSISPAAGAPGLNSLVLSWIPAGGNVTGYRIYVSSAAGGESYAAPYTNVTGATTSGTAYSAAGAYVAGQLTVGATINGLLPNTSYYVVVRAFYFDGANVFSDSNLVEVKGTTNSIVAPTFAGAASGAPGAGQLALSTATVAWAAPQSNGVWDGFQVAYEPGSCAAGFSAAPQVALASGISTTSYTVTGLTANTVYRFRVRSNYSVSNLQDTNTACVQTSTTATAPVFSGVSAVTDAAGIPGFTQLNVSWPQATGSFSYYLVEWANNIAFIGATALANITAITTTSAAITGLPSNTLYYVRVTAVYSGVTPPLTAGTSAVLSAITLPPAPSGEGISSVSVASATSLALAWTAPTNGGLYSGYKLWRACSATAASDIITAVSGAPFTTLGSSSLSYTDTGLTSNTPCCYQLRAYYSDGTHALTSQSNAASQCGTPLLVAPAFAGVQSVTNPNTSAGFTQLNVAWNQISASDQGNFSYYEVAWATTPTGQVWGSGSNLQITNYQTISTTITGLTANTTYYVAVRAVNAAASPVAANGANSVLSGATTPLAPVGDNLSAASAAGAASINLSYTAPASGTAGGLYNNVFLYVYQGSIAQLNLYQQNLGGTIATTGNATFATTLGSGQATLSSAPTAGALIRVPTSAFTAGANNTFTITGLTTGQQVCVLATAVYWVSGVPSQFLTSSTPSSKCATPTAVAPAFAGVSTVATPISSLGFSQLNVSWSAIAAGDVSNFSYYEVGYATTPTPASWTTFQVLSASASTASITGLTANTVYYVRVLAVNSLGSTPVSNGSSAVLQGTTTPKAPTGDSLAPVSAASATSVQLSYVAPSATAATGGLFNNVFLWVYQGTSTNVANYQAAMGVPVLANITTAVSGGLATLAAAPTSGALVQVPSSEFTAGVTNTLTLAGLTTNAQICIRALAVNWVNGQSYQYLSSQTPSTQCATPSAGAPIFAGVSSLTGFSNNRDFTQITANWTIPTGQCTSIDVSASTAQASPDFTTATFAAAKGLSCSTASYTITGLSPKQTYYVQVRANNSACGSGASCSSGAGIELSKVTVPPTPTGDGVTAATFSALSKTAYDSAALSWTLPSGIYWNKIAIWRASGPSTSAAATAVKAAANAYGGTGGSQTNAPLTMIAQASTASATATTYTDAAVVDGTTYCYLVRAVYDDGTYYNASANQTTQCGASSYNAVGFSGLNPTGSAVNGTWADGTAKIRLQFPGSAAGDIEEFWVYYSPSSSLSAFDLTAAPWQIVDNTATNAYNPGYPGGSYLYVGGQGRTFSGNGYFIVRAVHYGLSNLDNNTAISNAVAIPTAQSNYVYVDPSISMLGYPYWIGTYEASLASGSLGADAVSSTETSLATCSYQFHVNGVAKHSTCGSFASTGVA